MSTIVIIGIVVVWSWLALTFWAACVVAKRADRDMGIDD